MIKESLSDESKMTSSIEKAPRQTPKQAGEKLIISIDNLRIVGYRLDEDHPDYSPDSFDAVSHYKLGDLSKEAREAYNILQYSNVVELRVGTYKTERVYTKR